MARGISLSFSTPNGVVVVVVVMLLFFSVHNHPTQPHLWWSWALGPAFRAHIICIISEQLPSPLPCVSKREAWNRYAHTLSTVFEEIRRELNCLFFVLSWPFISRARPAILNMQKYAVSIHYWQCDLDFFFMSALIRIHVDIY